MRLAPWIVAKKRQSAVAKPPKKAKRKKDKRASSNQEGATTRKDPPRSVTATTPNIGATAGYPITGDLNTLIAAAVNRPGFRLPGTAAVPPPPAGPSPSVAGGVLVSPPVPEITTTNFHSVAGNQANLQDDWSVAEHTIRTQAQQIAYLQTQVANQDMSSTVASSGGGGKKRKIADTVKNILRKAMKGHVFRHTKFVSSDEQCTKLVYMILKTADANGCFTQVNGKFEPTPYGKQLAETYSTHILQLLNQIRQYASNQIKGVFFSYWDYHKKVIPIDTKAILKVLQRDEDLDTDLFEFYWDQLLPRAEGNAKTWPESLRYFGCICDFAPQDEPTKPYITPSTEAWLVLCIENCASRWPVLYKEKQENPGGKLVYSKTAKVAKPGYKVVDTSANKEYVGKYTTMDAGQKQFSGWSKEGLQRYKELLKLCKAGRAKATTKAIEQGVLHSLRAKHGITSANWDAHTRLLRGGTGDIVAVEEVEGLIDDDDWADYNFKI